MTPVLDKLDIVSLIVCFIMALFALIMMVVVP